VAARDRDSTVEAIDRLVLDSAHPLQAELQGVRRNLLAADPSIREGIEWNPVSFRNQNDFLATVHLRSAAAPPSGRTGALSALVKAWIRFG